MLGSRISTETSDEMGGAAGIDGNLDFVGAAALDLVVERLYANNTAQSEHPKEVSYQGTWHEGATYLPPREIPHAPSRSREPAKAKQ